MVEENNAKNVTLVKLEENVEESMQPALIIDADLPSKPTPLYRIKWIARWTLVFGFNQDP